MRKKEITVQLVDPPMREVVQAVEPEATCLLTEKGGKVTRYDLHGMYYWDYLPPEDHIVLYWPPKTLSAYVSARGQEDSCVTFAVYLLPASIQELHMVYDYRLSSPCGPFEEYFTLRVAHEQEYILRELRALPHDEGG